VDKHITNITNPDNPVLRLPFRLDSERFAVSDGVVMVVLHDYDGPVCEGPQGALELIKRAVRQAEAAGLSHVWVDVTKAARAAVRDRDDAHRLRLAAHREEEAPLRGQRDRAKVEKSRLFSTLRGDRSHGAKVLRNQARETLERAQRALDRLSRPDKPVAEIEMDDVLLDAEFVVRVDRALKALGTPASHISRGETTLDPVVVSSEDTTLAVIMPRRP